MVKLVQKSAFVVAAAALLWFPTTAFAQSALTSQHIEKIRENCLSAQVTLQRIQYSDVAIRINRGQAYDALLSKFIAPFNSRAALNRVAEVTQLTEKASVIESALADFKQSYVAYEELLSDTLHIKCQDRPVAFYDSLNQTRQLRVQLAEKVKKIHTAITEYTTVVTKIQKSLNGGSE